VSNWNNQFFPLTAFPSTSENHLFLKPVVNEEITMSISQSLRKLVVVLTLVLTLVTTTACSAVSQNGQATYQPQANRSLEYGEIARGDTPAGQNFGDWVVQTSQGLIKDAYVRENNKLGVVISSKVRPDEVKPLAQALVQGFRRSTPNRDVTVMVYAPDKQRILTARYNAASRQVEYNT
jgi:ribosomal protein S8